MCRLLVAFRVATWLGIPTVIVAALVWFIWAGDSSGDLEAAATATATETVSQPTATAASEAITSALPSSSPYPSSQGAASVPTSVPYAQPTLPPDAIPQKFWIEGTSISADLKPGGVNVDNWIYPPAGVASWFTGANRVTPGLPGIGLIAGHVGNAKLTGIFDGFCNVEVGATAWLEYKGGARLKLWVVDSFTESKTKGQDDVRLWGSSGDVIIDGVSCDPKSPKLADGHCRDICVKVFVPATS